MQITQKLSLSLSLSEMGFQRSQTMVFLNLMLLFCLVTARQLKNNANVEEEKEEAIGKSGRDEVAVNHVDPTSKNNSDKAKMDVGEMDDSPPLPFPFLFPPPIPMIPALPIPLPNPVPVPTIPVPVPIPTVPLPPFPPIPGVPSLPIPSPPM